MPVDWERLHQRLRNGDYKPPVDRPLADLTAELTQMLGSPDPRIRDELALPLLTTWIERGAYDDLLPGLGDGMATGLLSGLGEQGTDSVFRRSFSALVLAECVDRDNRESLVPPGRVVDWGDRIATWLLSERDLRGFVPGKGWAHAVAHGADALGVLAASPHFGAAELAVLLEVIGERLTLETDAVWTAGEPDRLASATLSVLHRGVVPLNEVERWLADLTRAGRALPGPSAASAGSVARTNTVAFLRALYLHLAIGRAQPPGRTDLLLTVIDRLRVAQPGFFG